MIEELSTASSLLTSTSKAMLSLEGIISSSPIIQAMNNPKWSAMLFPASLPPFLLFLKFLAYPGNRLGRLAYFGFDYYMLFSLIVLPAGILAEKLYGNSINNVDWLHGAATTVLTVPNILIAAGLLDSMTNKEESSSLLQKGRNVAYVIAALFVLCCATGRALGCEEHTQFLLGIGNLPKAVVSTLPWAKYPEPINALSIPSWVTHVASAYSYLFVMDLVWKYAETTQTPAWKGLTWAMWPSLLASVCALTFHFFYNNPSLKFLSTMVASLTVIGNLTCAYAAFRIARCNGWTLKEWFGSSNKPQEVKQPLPLRVRSDMTESASSILVNVTLFSVVASYFLKYGVLCLDDVFAPKTLISLLIVWSLPLWSAYHYYQLSRPSTMARVMGKVI